MKTEDMPLVTCVVIAYNNADTISDCLGSVLSQDYPRKEVVLVSDDGSTDGTPQLLEGLLREREGSFELIQVRHMGRSAARNVGWRRGRGSVVFFADADDRYRPEYLREAVAAVSSEGTGCVCVTGESLVEGDGLASRMLNIYSRLQVKKRSTGAFRPSWAWVYTKDALEAAGGFDERLDQAEDRDLFQRVASLGYKAAVVEGVHWYHRRPKTSSSYFRKSLYGGARRVKYLAKRRDYAGFFRSSGIFWVFLTAAVGQLVFPYSAALVLLALASALAFRGFSAARLVWKDVPRKTDFILFPFFTLASHTVSAAGTLAGALAYPGSSARPPPRNPGPG